MAEIIDYGFGNIERVAECLGKGMVGILPVDTIYGISSTVSEEGSARIYEIKERPRNKNFIVLMTKDQVLSSGLIVPDDILSLWPCSLTAVLPYPDGRTLAVRVPGDEYLQRLLPLSGPIYSTSVNISGTASLLSYDEILPVFGGRVDFIVKNTDVRGGQSSTLIDATKKPYRILRQGSYILDL